MRKNNDEESEKESSITEYIEAEKGQENKKKTKRTRKKKNEIKEEEEEQECCIEIKDYDEPTNENKNKQNKKEPKQRGGSCRKRGKSKINEAKRETSKNTKSTYKCKKSINEYFKEEQNAINKVENKNRGFLKDKVEKIEEHYEKAKSDEIERENEDSGKKLILESTYFEKPNSQTKKRSFYNMSFNENHRGNNYNYNNKTFNIPLEEPGDDSDKSYDNYFTDEGKQKIFNKRIQSALSVLHSDYSRLVNSSQNVINEIHSYLSDIRDCNNNKISTMLNQKRRQVELESNYYAGPHFYRKNDDEIYCFVPKEKIIYGPK